MTVEEVVVHSPHIEGNLMGESPDRQVFVVLPPSYEEEPDRRYPVLYALHGYYISAEQWMVEIHAPQTIEGAFAQGAEEMIVVLPTSRNAYRGSRYASSVTTGDFENFIAKDVVAYVDENYRTLPARESRGLVGHSMGGYGTIRIAAKHPDVFGAFYVMSSGLSGLPSAPNFTEEQKAQIEALTSAEEAFDLEVPITSALARAAAFSPNPQNPPLYLDLPMGEDPEADEVILAKWYANSPDGFLDQYVNNLRQYSAIGLEVGDADRALAGVEALSAFLTSYDIDHQFEVYEGDHTNRLGFRFQEHVIPFFSEVLVRE